MTPRTRWVAGLGVLAAVMTTVVTGPGAAEAADRPEIVPLSADLEAVRATEATELYGSPDILPMEDRATSIMTMGDSQISGEGVGNYLPETHRDGNWCDRSYDQAVFRTGIDSDVQYNIACSGAVSQNLIRGGETQWDEMNQGDNLAVKARNTKLKLVWVVIGANDKGGIEFGPVATECVTNRVLFKGTCWEDYSDDWAARVEVVGQGVTNAVADVRQTMTEAGYLDTDYQLVFQSYPSPMSPDVQDNPDFPGWYGGGCTMYLEDLAFARNKAVPLFDAAIRDAVMASGARYLDNSRLFDGHAVCDDNTWARGLYIELPVLPSSNAFRQSFHPNYRGHGAYASCVTDFFDHPDWQTATCLDPNSSGSTVLYQGLLTFRDIKSVDTAMCADGEGYNSRNGTTLMAHECHGGRNQGFYYDQQLQSLHVELSQDRCVDATDAVAGAEVVLWDCHGGDNQKFTVVGDSLRLVADPNLCLSMPAVRDDPMTVATCGEAGTALALADRDYPNPVGYGHDDWIGTDTY